jgi:hypothetical protein
MCSQRTQHLPNGPIELFQVVSKSPTPADIGEHRRREECSVHVHVGKEEEKGLFSGHRVVDEANCVIGQLEGQILHMRRLLNNLALPVHGRCGYGRALGHHCMNVLH